MSGFLPPVVMKIMADGQQFITEQGKVTAAMDAAAANAVKTAEMEAQAARMAASEAKMAADQQVLAAETAAKAAQVAADRSAAAQERAMALTGEAQQRAVNEAELAAAKQAEAYGKAAQAAQRAADMQVEAQAKIEAADAKTAAAAEASAARGEGAGAGKVSTTMAMGGTVLAAGLAVAAGEAVKQAANYEKATTLLQTAGGELASNMQTVRDGILQVAQATGTSTEQLTEGMYTVEKAGYRGADGLNVLKMAAEGAKAENVDLGTMTQALTSIMMSYHMGANQATSATNMLVAGAGAAKETMQNYAGALSTVLPVASAAGIGFDQVAGGIATLTQHGTSAAESTQELANTIRNLQAPNNVAVNAMQQLGINVNDLSTHLGQRGLTGTLDVVTNAIANHLGPGGTVLVDTMKKSATATQDLQTMLGKMPPKLAEAAKAFLDGSMSQKAFQQSFKDMGAEGSAQGKQFMTLAQTVKGYNDRIKAGGPAAQTATAALKAMLGGATGMNTALMLTGENMKGFKARVEEVSKAGKQNGSDLSTWAQTQATLSVQSDKTGQAFEALAIRMGNILAPAAKVAMGAMQAVFQFFAQQPAAAIAVAVALGVLATGMLIAAAAQWAMNSAMLANPLTWIIVGIVAVVAALALLVANWGTVVNFLSTVWGGFINWMGAVMGGFVNWWNGVWSGITGFVTAAVANVIGWVSQHWGLLLSLFIGPLGMVIQWVSQHWSQIVDVFAATWNTITSGVSGFLGFLGGIWNGFWSGPFGRLIINVFRLIVVSVQFAMAAMGVGIRTGMNFIGSVWNTTWGAISGFFVGVWNHLVAFATSVINVVRAVITAEVNAILSVWRAIWSTVSSFFTSVWNAIVAFVTGAAQNVYNAVSGPLHQVWSVIQSLLTSIWNVFVAIWNNVVNAVSGAWDRIVSGVSGGADNVMGVVGDLAGRVLGAINGLGGQLFSAGANIVSSLANGIMNGVGQVADAIGNIVKTISDHMPHSPAKVGPLSGFGYTLYSGRALVKDFARGMHDNAHLIAAASDVITGNVRLGGIAGTAPDTGTTGQGQPSPAAQQAGGRGTVNNITVYAQTNASAPRIAAELGFQLQLQG